MKKTHREKVTMDIKEKLDALRSGDLSRRAFNTALSAVGVSLVAMPMASRRASAAANVSYFTWGGYVPDKQGGAIAWQPSWKNALHYQGNLSPGPSNHVPYTLLARLSLGAWDLSLIHI